MTARGLRCPICEFPDVADFRKIRPDAVDTETMADVDSSLIWHAGVDLLAKATIEEIVAGLNAMRSAKGGLHWQKLQESLFAEDGWENELEDQYCCSRLNKKGRKNVEKLVSQCVAIDKVKASYGPIELRDKVNFHWPRSGALNAQVPVLGRLLVAVRTFREQKAWFDSESLDATIARVFEQARDEERKTNTPSAKNGSDSEKDNDHKDEEGSEWNVIQVRPKLYGVYKILRDTRTLIERDPDLRNPDRDGHLDEQPVLRCITDTFFPMTGYTSALRLLEALEQPFFLPSGDRIWIRFHAPRDEGTICPFDEINLYGRYFPRRRIELCMDAREIVPSPWLLPPGEATDDTVTYMPVQELHRRAPPDPQMMADPMQLMQMLGGQMLGGLAGGAFLMEAGDPLTDMRF